MRVPLKKLSPQKRAMPMYNVIAIYLSAIKWHMCPNWAKRRKKGVLSVHVQVLSENSKTKIWVLRMQSKVIYISDWLHDARKSGRTKNWLLISKVQKSQLGCRYMCMPLINASAIKTHAHSTKQQEIASSSPAVPKCRSNYYMESFYFNFKIVFSISSVSSWWCGLRNKNTLSKHKLIVIELVFEVWCLHRKQASLSVIDTAPDDDCINPLQFHTHDRRTFFSLFARGACVLQSAQRRTSVENEIISQYSLVCSFVVWIATLDRNKNCSVYYCVVSCVHSAIARETKSLKYCHLLVRYWSWLNSPVLQSAVVPLCLHPGCIAPARRRAESRVCINYGRRPTRIFIARIRCVDLYSTVYA